MVPKRVGDDLRRRRLQLRLKQADVAAVIHATRAYVSAVENGVDWDPDTEKLVAWSRLLGWGDDEILRRLNRVAVPVGDGGSLSPELTAAIQNAVTAGIRDGIEEVMRLLHEDQPLPETQPGDRRERSAAN